MTGYGQASGGDDRHQVSVTLRSVNGKYLDFNLRVREEHRSLEPRLRERLEEQVRRGRVDASVEVLSRRPRSASVDVQMEVVRALHVASHELAEKGLIVTELRLADLLALPEVVTVRVEPDLLSEADEDLVVAIFGEAVEQLVGARSLEGRQLAAALADRIDELERLVDAIVDRISGVRERIRSGMEDRLRDLLGDRDLDPGRLVQEVALLVDRSDVTEEVDRLQAHLAHFRSVIGGEDAIGKRLDFLSQEILRELNTIGSKARDAEMARHVVDAKVVCEQVREQVQNVE